MRKVDLCKGNIHHEKKNLGLIGRECDYPPCQEQRNKLKGEMKEKGLMITEISNSNHNNNSNNSTRLRQTNDDDDDDDDDDDEQQRVHTLLVNTI